MKCKITVDLINFHIENFPSLLEKINQRFLVDLCMQQEQMKTSWDRNSGVQNGAGLVVSGGGNVIRSVIGILVKKIIFDKARNIFPL